MSITAEQIARREFTLLEAPDRVPVSIRVDNVCGLMLPRPDGEYEETATFNIWTYGDNQIIEKACRYPAMREDGKEVEQTDINEMRRLILKRSLLSWSLPIELERENGWLTPECYHKVGNVSGPIIEAFVYEFERSFRVTEEEEVQISKQCAVLFGSSSRGVADACEAISMFCTYGNFNEKFGITREEVSDIPYKEYQLLRIVMGKEGESAKRERNKKDHHAATRVATGGTQIRASRGTKIALH